MTTRRSESLTATVDPPFPEYDSPPQDPPSLLRRWLDEAGAHGVREPRALALATVGTGGRPSLRTVVLSAVTDAGLVFATHAGSRKGRELSADPAASGLLYWREIGRQISVGGTVRQVPDAESDAMWASRPEYTHAMTVSSRQSEVLPDMAAVAELRSRAAAVAGQGPQPRPASYVGLELVLDSVEFWANGTDRLHERLRYDRTATGWAPVRLQP